MTSILIPVLESILRMLGWISLGFYRAKYKATEKSLRASEKANEIRNKIINDSKYRDNIDRMRGKK